LTRLSVSDNLCIEAGLNLPGDQFEEKIDFEGLTCVGKQNCPPSSITVEYAFCCEGSNAIKTGCVSLDEDLPSSNVDLRECDGLPEPVCDDSATECADGKGINPVLPIVGSVVAVLVIALVCGGVYFFYWNRKRLNSKAKQDIAQPFTTMRP